MKIFNSQDMKSLSVYDILKYFAIFESRTGGALHKATFDGGRTLAIINPEKKFLLILDAEVRQCSPFQIASILYLCKEHGINLTGIAYEGWEETD